MKKVKIQAEPFFELLKLKNQSMWEIFSQMIREEEQELIFINDKQEVLFSYILPDNLETLKKDQKTFSEEFKQKIIENLEDN